MVLTALVFSAAPARSAEGIYLTWNECPLSTLSASDFTASCAADSGEQSLYCAFTMPFALDSVIAVEITLDVQVAGSLPPYWEYAADGCRFGSLSAKSEFAAATACTDFWAGRAGMEGLAGYYAGEPRGGAGQARIRITFAVASGQYLRLDAERMYYAARVVFKNRRTTSCLGCSTPACLVLNSILIGRLPGAPGGDHVCLEVPGPNLANRATWQGVGGDCNAVPVKVRTWGQLKSLYR